MNDDICKHCGGPKAARNPTGKCDHLYWPDNLTYAAKVANGLRKAPPLSDDELDTILAIAANGQSGRITPYEIRALVDAYRKQHGMLAKNAEVEDF